MIRFQIHPRILRALIPFISTDSNRRVLGGICISIVPEKKIIAVATDGRRLLAINASADAEFSSITERVEFIIPRALLLPIPKSDNKRGFVTICKNETTISIEGDKSVSAKMIEGNYPNWMMVIPRGKPSPVSEIRFAPDCMEDFFKSARILNPRNTYVHVITNEPIGGSAESPYTIKPYDNAGDWIGILMPVRGTVSSDVPEWIQEQQPNDPAPPQP